MDYCDRRKPAFVKKGNAMMKSLVSVIITTKNEGRYLEACLHSIKKQTYRAVEIEVVDNASSDETKKIAKKFTSNVFDKGPERSAQRNFGAARARGDYLLFLDADMILEPSVIADCVRKAQKGYEAITIPEKSVGVGFWARCKAIEREYYQGVEWMEAARFYKKEQFDRVHGYDESLTGPEDFELSQRIASAVGKENVGRISSFIVHDEGRLSLVGLLQKKYYYGKQMRRYSGVRESKSSFNKQANILRRYVLFFTKPSVFLKDPLHGIGMLFMKGMNLVHWQQAA